jgi:hypothetical protein
MWRLRSCPEPGDRSRGHEARGGFGAPVRLKAGVGATGHASMCVHLIFHLDSKLIHRSTRSLEYR